MNNSRATFKAILIALFLLLTQAAVVAHAIDHDLTEHSEWCQLLNKADVSFAVNDSPQLFERIAERDVYTSLISADVVTSPTAHYFSRAPPTA